MGRSSSKPLVSDDQAEFDLLLEACRAEFSPEDVYEGLLVEQLAWCRWRLARFLRLEAIARDSGEVTAADAMRSAANTAQKSTKQALRAIQRSRKLARKRKPQLPPALPGPLEAGDTAYRA